MEKEELKEHINMIVDINKNAILEELRDIQRRVNILIKDIESEL